NTRFSRDWSSDVCSSDLVEYSFAISKYSLIVTFTGIEGKFFSSQTPIFKRIVSTSAILSTSQLLVLSWYVFPNSEKLRIVFLNNCLAKSLSSSYLKTLATRKYEFSFFNDDNCFTIAVFTIGTSSIHDILLSSIKS